MVRVAFYAPMKAPDSPVPSGDREMARNLMAAIGADGHRVDLVSRLRIYDKTGDPDLQNRLYREAAADVDRIYLTEVHAEVEGDTVFPGLAADTWREVSREDHPADENNNYDYSFTVLERI